MQSEIADKIKKLLALAKRSTFAAESASAMAKAQALMLEHGIEESKLIDTEAAAVAEHVGEAVLQYAKRVDNWKYRLAATLAKSNGCFIYQNRHGMIIVGTKANSERVHTLYAYCIDAVEDLCKLPKFRGNGKTWNNNFKHGCVDAIKEAIKQEIAYLRQRFQIANDCRALVVIDKLPVQAANAQSIATKLHNLTSSSSGGSASFDAHARSAGRQAGAGIYSGSKPRIGA